MFELGEVIALMCFGAALVIIGVMLGGWIMFKSKNAVPGENFIGGAPKGEVFTLPDTVKEDLDEDAKKGMLERTEQFLKVFEGGGKE